MSGYLLNSLFFTPSLLIINVAFDVTKIHIKIKNINEYVTLNEFYVH